MKISSVLKFALSALVLSQSFAIHAATIYPINDAAILMGSKFDIKVEFNTVVPEDAIRVTVNGAPLKSVVSVAPEFIANENGKGSSIIYRDVQLKQAGQFVIDAKAGDEVAKVTWDV